MCGGTRSAWRKLAGVQGLSPRVRGNRRIESGRCRLLGSIPACAGEPKKITASLYSVGVYPRVCGGTCSVNALFTALPGLSPRVRGNRSQHVPSGEDNGSIPACAGEPAKRVPLQRQDRVYPRVCGGTLGRSGAGAVCQGLSPRVRGNLGQAALGPGSIPACAGEPSAKRTRPGETRVYPRVCGGTERISKVRHDTAGLSPRVRGNRRTTIPCTSSSGSIPACAGEPV